MNAKFRNWKWQPLWGSHRNIISLSRKFAFTSVSKLAALNLHLAISKHRIITGLGNEYESSPVAVNKEKNRKFLVTGKIFYVVCVCRQRGESFNLHGLDERFTWSKQQQAREELSKKHTEQTNFTPEKHLSADPYFLHPYKNQSCSHF